MTPEASRVLRHLAGCPFGSSSVERKDLRDIMLDTGGNMLACGSLYDIKAESLGAGVYRLTLKLTNHF